MFIFKMKLTIRSVFILSLSLIVCVGCSKKDDNDPSTDDNSQNVLSGKISNYTAGTIDSLKFCYAQDIQHIRLVLGRGAVATDGTFSIKLSTPPDSLLEGIGETESGVTYSDITVKGCGSEHYGIIAYKNKSVVGSIVYANDVYNTVILRNGGYWSNTDDGWSYCNPCYFDKNVTITGTHSDGSNTQSYQYTYDITAKKGWNNIYWQHNYSKSGSVVTESEKTTTTLPANYKWYYYSLSSISSVKRQNAKSVFTGLQK